MSLTKLLMTLSPSKLFQKDVITFLIIRRHDLGQPTETLRYISVRPNASLSTLRHKIWHLLDLPDYCDEQIILKTDRHVEVPLTELRKGNTPQSPFYLEVWLPEKRAQCSPMHMLTMGRDDDVSMVDRVGSESTCDCNTRRDIAQSEINYSQTTVSIEPIALHIQRPINTMTQADFRKSDVSSRISSTTFFKLHGKKSKDNFSNILLKIQTDLGDLSQKLSSLENRIPA